MRFSSSVFIMNQKYLGPRVIPQNISEKFSFSQKYSQKKVFFVVISGIRYPEVAQPPGIISKRLHNLRVTIHGNCQKKTYTNKLKEILAKFNKISEYGCEPLGIVTQRLHNLRVTIPEGCTAPKYCYPEVAQPPCNNILKSNNLRIQLPGGWILSKKLKKFKF